MRGMLKITRHHSARRIALTVAGGFAGTGAAWVLITDYLLYRATRDVAVIARLETAKGWAFIVLATVLVYVLTYYWALTLTRARAAVVAIIDSIADGVLLLGRDRRILRANEAAIEMLKTRELAGMNATEFSRRFRPSNLDGSLLPPDQFLSMRVFAEGGPLVSKAMLYPPGSRELIVSVTAAAVRERADDSPDLVVSVLHDISEWERLGRVRDQCFAAAAHALKTPVAVMKTSAHALAASEAAPAVEHTARVISHQCDRVDLLVQNLFVLARIRTDSLELYRHEVELGLLVEQVTHAMATATGHEIGYERQGTARVDIDQERIALVLRNLLDEAVRSSAPGQPVHVRVTDPAGRARVDIRYMRGAAWPCAGEADELGINRIVTSTVVKAHGGELAQAGEGADMAVSLVLPALAQGHGNAA